MQHNPPHSEHCSFTVQTSTQWNLNSDMSIEAGSSSYERMPSELMDGSDFQDGDVYPEHRSYTQRTLAHGIFKSGPWLTQQRPYRLATACLATFCVVLLITLLIVSTQKKSSDTQDGDQNSQNSPSFSKFTTCVNVSALTAEQERLEKKYNELLKENDQLKHKIKVLETPPTPKPVQCTGRWQYFNGSCYLISASTRSWRDSERFCNKEGGHLAIIHTAEEQTFLWDRLPRGHWNSYWIGISDEIVEGDWYWVDGTKLIGGFWEYGEPNNHINEDCGYIVKTEVLTRIATKSWYDAPCTMSLPWICEKKAVQASA